MKWERKQIIGLIALLLVTAIAVGGIALWLQENKLEQLQNDALAELERNAGQYDEQSIVLYETSKAKADELAKLYGATLRITENGRFATLTLPEGTTIRDVYAMEESRKYIDEMAADYHVKASELTEEETEERIPTRPQYTVSDSDYELQTYLDYLNMGEVWRHYTGTGVTVAVIDSGIDTDHPEFAGRISEYSYNASTDKIVKDFLLEDGSYDWSLIEDEQGHGTAVTGVIAASMNSGNVVGIAPDVEIIVIKADCYPDGQFKRASDLVFGIYYAIERDVQVVNMSFGGDQNIFGEVLQLAYDSDVICVAAAGNDGSSKPCYPAADDNAIGVGALEGWELASYSNYGENVDLCAPGTTWTSTMDGGYGYMSGTSLAAPCVTGAIALYMQTAKYATFDDVTELLYASCYDLGDLGRDWYHGFGAIDISALIMEPRGKITYEMLTDELENLEGIFIQGHTLQELPEPERLYAVFDGWYYDDTFTLEYNYYQDKFYGDEITLYAKWANEDDGIPYTYVILDDGTVEIRSYTGHRRYISIPEKIEGRVVSSIGDFAFAGESQLREVKLPSGLTNIGMGAFRYCSNLINMQIPKNVTQIGERAFYGNVRLTSITFEADSSLQQIGDFAFADCATVERIELPASLQDVDGSAFYRMSSLYEITVQQGNTAFQSDNGVLLNFSGTTIIAYPMDWGTEYALPEGIQYIGDYAFAYAPIDEINLTGVVNIGKYAFVCADLDTLVIPDSVTKIGGSAFETTSITNLTIGRGITEIPGSAFKNTSMLREVTIPNTICSIGAGSFEASGIEQIHFEEDCRLVDIGGQAFYQSSLESITIPKTVVSIGNRAFMQSGLVSVYFEEESGLQYLPREIFNGCQYLEEVKLPNSIRTIGDWAFYECSKLLDIKLPDSLSEIGENAFAKTGLNQIAIPVALEKLGDGVFAYCRNLSYIAVDEANTHFHSIEGVLYSLDNKTIFIYPAGMEGNSYTVHTDVETIAPYAFAGTNRLDTVVLPDTLQVIGEYAFCDAGIVRIDLPEALTEIQEYAFSDCVNLERIRIPDHVIMIGRYAFAGDWNLITIEFNETSELARIGYAAFADCGIQYFVVPANVSTMGQKVFDGCAMLSIVEFAPNSKLSALPAYVFAGCGNLQSITFYPGSDLTSIQAHALDGMTRLNSIEFGDAMLTNVDNFAFRFCTNLTEIHLPETVMNIGRYAFYGCKNLSQLTIPAAIEHIGSYAFLGTNEMELFFQGETLPLYLDEEWDRSIRGYYTGVSDVAETDDYRYAVLPSGSIGILEYRGSEEHVDLTQVDLGGPITVIGGGAFKASTVKTIVLPDTLTAIQAEAFQYAALESISIPANVTFIGREAFAYTNIQTLTFAENAKITMIEQYAFEGTKNLTSVTLPASVTTLGTGVFLQSGLQSITFAPGSLLEEIPQRAFAETKLTAVDLPDSVTLVNHNAFNNVQTLQSLTFGNNDGIRLMSNAFYHTGLTSLHIPANVTYIGEYCFVALGNLTEFSVDENNPNYKAEDGLLLNKSGRKLIAVPAGRTGSLKVPVSIEEIGFGAFEESKLSEILFDENANILTFGYRAFFKANGITTITVPKSVVSIDYYAFAYCENLTEVIFAEDNQLKGIYEGAFCGDGNLENIILPDSIVEISDFAFYGCRKIKSLPVSATHSLKGIYDYAFAYTGLEGEFTTPETLWDIGEYAFLGCDFTKVTIPDTNKKILIIDIGAFEGCNQLEEIQLPFVGASYEDTRITWFGYIFGAGSNQANAVYVPESLKTVTLTDDITFIPEKCFWKLEHIERMNIPHSVSVVFDYAFSETTAIYELTNVISTADGTVDQNMFGYGISGKLTLSDSVTKIGIYAFKDCANLREIVIGENCTSIGSEAFQNCTGLTGISLPDGVQYIGNRTFMGCSNLSEVKLPASMLSIGSYAFADCDKLTEVNLPETLESIGDYAFVNCDGLTQIEIPGSVQTIGYCAFNRCWNLSEVVIHNGVATIGDYAFGECAFEEIMIPASVTSIGHSALHTENLKSIQVSAENTVYATHDGILYNKEGTQILFLPEQISGEITIPGTLATVADSQFSGRNLITSVTISSGTMVIGENAFSGCTGMQYVHIPDTVTQIGRYAFYNCSGLQEVQIPAAVKTIEEQTFQGCSGLQKLSLSEGLQRIETHAFRNCAGLRELVIPEGVTYIGGGAFTNSSSLTSVTLPQSLETIDDWAFSECTLLFEVYNNSAIDLISAGNHILDYAKILIDKDGNKTYFEESGAFEFYETADGFRFAVEDGAYRLVAYIGEDDTITLPLTANGQEYTLRCFSGAKHVIIPEGFTVIPDAAFQGSTLIETIVIPNTVTTIESNAFYGCKNLKEVVVPDSVHTLGWYVFDNCESLERAVLPDSITTMGRCVFSRCVNLKEVNIPSGLTVIPEATFSTCRSLENIVIPATVTEIYSSAFYDTGLKEVVLPENLQFISTSAFDSCQNLQRVWIPDSVTEMYSNSFSSNTKLEMSSTHPCYQIVDGITYSRNNYAMIHVSKDLPADIVIPEGVTEIGYAMFKGNESIRSVVIPGSVTVIDVQAFSQCTNLEQVVIGEGVTEILSSAFAYNPKLRTIEIPGSVAVIGHQAFYDCASLEKVTMLEGVTTIRSGAFKYNPKLREVQIPDSVTVIQDEAFYGCPALLQLSLPENLETIGYNAFSGNMALTFRGENPTFSMRDGILYDGDFTRIVYVSAEVLPEVEIPEGVLEIPEKAFTGMAHIVSVTLPQSLTKIGSYAFSNCTGLTEIVIPDSVTELGDCAFAGCTSLTTITLPAGLQSIGTLAFCYCESLRSIEIPDSVTYLGQAALTECRSLETVKLPTGITELSQELFKYCSALKTVEIPNNVTFVHWYVFWGCSSLREVTFPDSVTYVGGNVFLGCDSLEHVTVGKGITAMEEWGLGSETPNLQSVTVSEENTVYASVGGLVLNKDMTQLILVPLAYRGDAVIPEGITFIPANAFANRNQLYSVKLPSTLQMIEDGAFSGCVLLRTVYNNSNLELTFGSETNGCVACYAQTIICKDGSELINENYEDSSVNYSYEFVTEDGFKFRYEDGVYYLVAYVGGQETVTLPSTVYDHEYELQNFTGAKNVIVPADTTRIAMWAFAGGDMESITFLGSIEYIGTSAFASCENLKQIAIPEGITFLDSYLFSGSSKLERIELPSTVSRMYGTSLEGCPNLKEIVVHPDNANYTSVNGILYSKDLYSLIFAPRGMSGHIEIPHGVVQIAQARWSYEGVFAGCTRITGVSLPETLEDIGEYAFYGCTNLTSINIPDSVRSIGKDAFAGTALFVENNGFVMVDGWIVDVAEDTSYIPIEGVKGAMAGAFDNCYLLKNMIWHSMISSASNVETLIIPKFSHNTSNLGTWMTLKNVVVLESVGIDGPLYANPLAQFTGVTIYVEALEKDLRWDDNFPGWNNGNKVYYGDQWHWVNFYDENGKLIYSEPCLNSKIIRLPVHEIEPDEKYTYEIIGWDLDGDGEADNIPATTIVDIHARPIVVAHERQYTVQFADANGTIYHELQLPYGAAVTAPDNPSKQGYDFIRWSGLYDGLTVTEDLVIYASWKHHGNGHHYADPAWVDATCSEGGYYVHICTICAEYYTTDHTDPLGHDYQENLVDATCTVGGYTLHSCSRCDDSYRDNFTNAKGHSYTEWVVDQQPQCAENGTRHRSCTVCGEQETDIVLPKGHAFVETERVEPTCTAEGESTLRCADCGLTVRDSLPVKNHSFEKTYTSESFLEWLIREILEVFWGYEGEQSYFYACADCGHVMNQQEAEENQFGIASTACRHKSATWAVVRQPDCTGCGLESQVCDTCGKVLAARTFGEQKQHELVQYEGKPATCTEHGWYDYEACANCDYSTYTEIPATGEHTYTSEVTTAPGCETAGVRTYTCAECGHSYDEVLPELGHNYTATVTEPTCTEQGYTTHTCSNCGDSYVDTYTDALGHNWSDWKQTKAPTCTAKGAEKRACSRCDASETREVTETGHNYIAVVTEPTCTEQGYTTHTCANCGDSYVDTYTDALGHAWSEWKQTKAPTCTEKGSESRSCDHCGKSETREVTENGHNYVTVVTEPTCTEQGYTTHTCANCGDSYVDTYTGALGHAWSDWKQTKAPTCTAKGAEERICSRCDASETQEVAETGHNYNTLVSEPTCTEQGYTTHTCANCGDSYVDTYTDALDHAWSEWKQTKAPTCTAKGAEQRTCSRCDHAETREVAATGHTEVIDKAVAPTCTATGLTEGKYCSVCNEVLVAQQTVEALGHDMGEWKQTKASTCTEKGAEQRTCSRCDHTETREIEPTGHNYTTVVTAPTCTEKGYTTYTCHCGDSYIADEVAAAGHGYTEWYTITEPGEYTDGLEQRDCVNCGASETRVIPAIGHTHSYEAVVTAPTCTENGYTSYTCRCGDSYTADEVAALGHNEVIDNAVAPTCTETGLTEGKHCSRCGEVLVTQKEVAATGHNYTSKVTTTPGCERDGVRTYTCSVCGNSYTETIPATGHQNTHVENRKEATCGADGYTGDTVCSDCGKTVAKGDVIPATGNHNYTSKVTTEPGCETNGVKTYTCSICGASYTETIAPTGHSYGAWYTVKEPGEYEDGLEQRDCQNCDHYETRPIPAAGHTHSYEAVVTAPSCTEKGYTTYTCRCGHSYVADEVAALGHDVGEWKQTKAPTCIEKGAQQRTCSRCDHAEIREIAENGHTEVIDKAVVPTCTQTGLTEGKHCSVCDEVLVAQQNVEALGHDMSAWAQTKAPTCTEKGEEQRTCSRCDHVETREVSATGHNYTAVVTEPTCTEKGYTTHTCSNCDDSYVDSYTNALGHDMDEWKQTKAPTCTESGCEQRTCSRCDYTETREVAATGHSYGAWYTVVEPGEYEDGLEQRDCKNCDHYETRAIPSVGHTHSYEAVVTAPTCTENGFTTYTCRCGDSYVADEVAALGHDEVIDEAVAPTCTETGLTEGKHCARCDEVLVARTVIDALGHSYEVVVTAPTCTENGYTTHTCTNCGATYTSDHVDAWGHSWNDGVVTKEPTTEDEGEKTYTCTVCGETRTETIAKKETVIYDLPEDNTVAIPENDCFEGGTTVTVEVIEEGETFETVTEVMENVAEQYVAYEFTATKDDMAVQPNGKLTVTFDIPADYSNNVAVYYMDENGKLTQLEAVVDTDERTVTVELEHFSTYIVVDKDTVPAALLGDVNGDGRINVRDARAILRYIAGLIEEDELEVNAADFNGDGRVNVRDARAILNYIAGMD